MTRSFSGLEKGVANNQRQFRSSAIETFSRISSPYRSQSEQVIGDILERNHIRFDYENELRIPDEHVGNSSDRVWHPDFHLRELGVYVEYAGLADDDEYAKGVEQKKEVYKQMGINVIWLYPEDLWEPTANRRYGKLREDVSEHILRKINEIVREDKKNYRLVA